MSPTRWQRDDSRARFMWVDEVLLAAKKSQPKFLITIRLHKTVTTTGHHYGRSPRVFDSLSVRHPHSLTCLLYKCVFARQREILMRDGFWWKLDQWKGWRRVDFTVSNKVESLSTPETNSNLISVELLTQSGLGMFEHLETNSQSVGSCVNNWKVTSSNPQGAAFPGTTNLSSRNWKKLRNFH